MGFRTLGNVVLLITAILILTGTIELSWGIFFLLLALVNILTIVGITLMLTGFLIAIVMGIFIFVLTLFER